MSELQASAEPRWRRLARRLLREPLLHFFVVGLALFLVAGVVKQMQRPVVRIDPQELGQLAAYWETQMQRPPSKAELAAIIRDRVDEEILAREALRLGLDRDDLIIRRRLAQKMTFASEDTANIAEPDEATLKAWYDKTRDAYALAPRYAFQHLFFAGDHASAAAPLTAAAALQRLKSGATNVQGDPFMLPMTYGDAAADELARDYGPGFVTALDKAPPGQWYGPIQSAFGYHLVRLEARRSGATPPFDTVRSEVRDAWLQDQRKRNNAAFMQKLRDKYRIDVAEAPPGSAR